MSEQKPILSSASIDILFNRVVTILDEAKNNVLRAVNQNMVRAYWLIGREIVEEIQRGEKRAEYGKKVIEDLSEKLTKRYKKGFSQTNLKNFRTFYQVYGPEAGIRHPLGDEFQLRLSWSHYRALMRVVDKKARKFYEQEAVESGWDKRTLERHIHSYYYERLLKSQKSDEPIEKSSSLAKLDVDPTEAIKHPYVLEFLGLPESSEIREMELETAIITRLQSFLLELGKGFAFVARQKRMQVDDESLFVDLVFYNCVLKCYLLIDLKVGKLSHQDVGQMDGYVRMFDDLYTASDDNPTIGLILCAEKNDTVAKYSVLKERKQVFASRYLTHFPSEEELANELAKERHLIEEHMEMKRLETNDEDTLP